MDIAQAPLQRRGVQHRAGAAQRVAAADDIGASRVNPGAGLQALGEVGLAVERAVHASSMRVVALRAGFRSAATSMALRADRTFVVTMNASTGRAGVVMAPCLEASCYEARISERWRNGYRCNVAGGRPIGPRCGTSRRHIRTVGMLHALKIFPQLLMPPNDTRGFLGPRIMESRQQPCQNSNAQCRPSNWRRQAIWLLRTGVGRLSA